ncbi:MAG: adenylosuccinate synthetase [Bacteroidota bacterium]
MTAQIVIGLGFGDEGKGMLTDHLCRKAERPLVVRFSGGHQAGHTVVTADGRQHVFSNFGAGTFAGAPTLWSRFCTFHPIGYANELAALKEAGVKPKLFVDGLAPVTTPYDLLYNRILEKKEKHGSCGLGFGATIARHEGPHKIHAMDLLNDFVLKQKLKSVANYYSQKVGITLQEKELDKWMDSFHNAVKVVRDRLHIISERYFFEAYSNQFSHLIFEGSQGILLDQEFGYFPHVTRAYTSSKNALEIIKRMDSTEFSKTQIHYVTRAYQTRHGNGPLSQEYTPGLELAPTPYETNQTNAWQGSQRRALLDLGQLRYALSCDAHYSAGLERYLTVSCLDQISGAWRAIDEGKPIELRSVEDLARRLQNEWSGVFGNYGQVADLRSKSEKLNLTI